MFGVVMEAAPGAAVFLLGDGVLCARSNQASYLGGGIATALAKSCRVTASARDLRARGISVSEYLEEAKTSDVNLLV